MDAPGQVDLAHAVRSLEIAVTLGPTLVFGCLLLLTYFGRDPRQSPAGRRRQLWLLAVAFVVFGLRTLYVYLNGIR